MKNLCRGLVCGKMIICYCLSFDLMKWEAVGLQKCFLLWAWQFSVLYTVFLGWSKLTLVNFGDMEMCLMTLNELWMHFEHGGTFKVEDTSPLACSPAIMREKIMRSTSLTPSLQRSERKEGTSEANFGSWVGDREEIFSLHCDNCCDTEVFQLLTV